MPPGALQQLDRVIGNRVETLAVLGSQSGVSGGAFVFDASDADAEIDVFRLAGRGGLGSPRPIGDSGIGWNLVFEGGIGGATIDNQYKTGALDGNESSTDTISASLAAGVRFTFLEHFSVAPTFGIIYSHTENEFKARTDTGRALLAQFDGILVNWDADVITLVPSVEGRYRQRFGPMTVELTSLYRYFETQPIRRSTEALSFVSHSQWWRNRLDVDFRLPLYVFGRQFRTGASFARAELFDGLEQSLQTDHIYDTGARFVVDLLGVLWGVEWIGVGGSYFWSDHFSGWSVGDRHPGEVLIAAAARRLALACRRVRRRSTSEPGASKDRHPGQVAGDSRRMRSYPNGPGRPWARPATRTASGRAPRRDLLRVGARNGRRLRPALLVVRLDPAASVGTPYVSEGRS